MESSNGLDDSGYGGLDSVKKVLYPEVKNFKKSNEEEKLLNETLTFYCGSEQDKFLVTAVNFFTIVVVTANLCYLMVMGDLVQDQDDQDQIKRYQSSWEGREQLSSFTTIVLGKSSKLILGIFWDIFP